MLADCQRFVSVVKMVSHVIYLMSETLLMYIVQTVENLLPKG